MDLLEQQIELLIRYCMDHGMRNDDYFREQADKVRYCVDLKRQEIDRLVDIISGDIDRSDWIRPSING